MSGPSDDDLEALAPGTFAGTWLRDGRLHIAYTADPEHHAAQARERLGLSANTTVVRRPRSLQDLRRVAAGVDEAAGELAALGATLYAVSDDVPDNVVEVVIKPATPAVRDLLIDRFGAAVRVIEGRVESV